MPVVIGSRDAGRAEEAAGRVREQVPDGRPKGSRTRTPRGAGPIVLLAVPFRAQSENLTNLKNVLEPGQILVDATVPLAAAVSGKATRLLGVPQGSAAEQAQEMVPDGVTVVSALHTVSAPASPTSPLELDEDVPICGDSSDDKRRVAELIARVPGLRPVNAGRARDGAAGRGPDAAADLGQLAQQGARRHPLHRPARSRAGSPPLRRHRRRQAGARAARRRRARTTLP